jgi:hypothetical protein
MRRELFGVNVKLITNKDDCNISESRKKNYVVAWKRAGGVALASTTEPPFTLPC